MSKRQEPFIEVLIKAPWWVSVFLGALVYAGVRWILPDLVHDKLLHAMTASFSQYANLALYFFGRTTVLSAIFSLKRSRLVDDQRSLDTLRSTPWKDFEYLVVEAFRRQGYNVDYSLGRGADGGVDMVLHRNGKTSLVQCKQWKKSSVGAPVIREMFGILTAQRAYEVIIVATGRFTREAKNFADGKPIRLVDGPELLELVSSVQNGKFQDTREENEVVHRAMPKSAPDCPRCGIGMVERVARKGANAGQKFWGCRNFPACKATSPA